MNNNASDNTNQTGAIVIDTPEGIAAYRLLALHNALKLEIKGLKSRFRVADQVRTILTKAQKKASRNKVKLLEEYESYLREIKVLQPKTS